MVGRCPAEALTRTITPSSGCRRECRVDEHWDVLLNPFGSPVVGTVPHWLVHTRNLKLDSRIASCIECELYHGVTPSPTSNAACWRALHGEKSGTKFTPGPIVWEPCRAGGSFDLDMPKPAIAIWRSLGPTCMPIE